MEFNVGDVVQGEVVSIKPYGAFLELENGEIGMIHISEIAEEYVSDIANYLAVGEEVMVKVIGENTEGKPNLSLKQLTPEELEEARFSREVEAVREALAQGNGEIVARLKRRQRPKPAPQEETLRDWIAEARRVLNKMEQRHPARRSPQEERG
ncbi:MAG: S1 RNA-binding domain-containing protein [Candidatus Bipolaricaulia bacterium]